MPWFRCLIRGEEFPGELAGHAGPVGFYVNRWVEAPDPGSAEQRAMAALKREPKLIPPAGVARPAGAAVYFEEVREVPEVDVPAVEQGFIWFPMDV